MTSDSPLGGATALVTGASRGIGAAVAERLAGRGADVWALARTTGAIEALAARIGGHPLPADLTDDVAVWHALDRLQEELGGPPDLVVNAAGVFSLGACASESVGAFDLNLAVNLRGAFLVVRALLPAMLSRGRGTIVNIGSVAGRKAIAGNASYAASKFGLRGFHEVLLEELRGSGVRASLVEPAATDTSLWDPLDPDLDPALPDRSAMLAPDDVAEAVLFIATRRPQVRIPVLQIERA